MNSYFMLLYLFFISFFFFINGTQEFLFSCRFGDWFGFVFVNGWKSPPVFVEGRNWVGVKYCTCLCRAVKAKFAQPGYTQQPKRGPGSFSQHLNQRLPSLPFSFSDSGLKPHHVTRGQNIAGKLFDHSIAEDIRNHHFTKIAEFFLP